jgi:hypothetical protein
MKRLLLPLLAGLIAVAAAQAGTIYTFSGTSSSVDGSMSFTLTTTPVTSDTTFLPGAELTCNQCDSITFFVDAVASGFTWSPSSAVAYAVQGAGTANFYFEAGSFTSNGTHASILLPGTNDASLTVSGATSATPEPSTFGLLLVPALALFGKLRKR